MSQNQRIISVFIALCMVFAMLPMQAFAEDGDIVASGTCGDNLTWTLDSAGVLTISGTGDMTKYSSSTQPWAEHMGKIQHVIISNGVTSISGNAFYKCSTLESIDIADTVKKIGGYAFYKCSALRTVTIPEGVSVVESRTFEDCTKLNTVELPSTLTMIEVNAFDGCTALRTCNIPESVTSIGQWAFYNCSLKDVSIPSGVKQLGNSVFYNCIFINKLMISEGVEVIGEHTFRECRNITEVTIPATVHSINACAFGGCKALNEITFVGDAPAFGSNVFLNVTSTAYYPSNNETWTEAARQSYGGTLTWVPYGACEHSYVYGVVTAPTAETEGRYYAECAVCGDYAEYPLPKLNDTDYACEGWQAATCTDPGKALYVWRNGDVYLEIEAEIPVAGHSYSYPDTAEMEPTLETEGLLRQTCSECGDCLDTVLPALNKTDYTYTVTAEPTCFGIGEATYAWVTEEGRIFNFNVTLPSKPHTQVTEVTPPSCTEQGYTHYRCIDCGDSYDMDYVDPTGHKWDSGKITSAASCDTDGVKTFTCTVCNETKTEAIPATGHSYTSVVTEPNCTEKGYTTHTCACGHSYVDTYVDALGHSYETVFTEPKCEEPGYNTYTCACGDSYVGDYNYGPGHYYQDGSCIYCGEPDPTLVPTYGGICGDSLDWSFDVTDGILSIYGTGEMYDFEGDEPWEDVRSSITKVIIEDGATSIGVCAFQFCENLTSVTIPSTVKKIGGCAFYMCTSLTNLVIPEGVEVIGSGAFESCYYLNVTLPESVTTLESYAFGAVRGMSEIVIPANVTYIGEAALSGEFSKITFNGAPPEFDENAFRYTEAEVYYPNDGTWPEAVRQSYGGQITWIPYGDEGGGEEISITVNTTAGSVTAPEGGWKEGANTFTVTAEKPCVVAVSYDGGATYTRLTASATGVDNTYSFTANDMTESSIVAVIMTGDANGDGAITNADVTRLKAAYQNKVKLDSLKWLAADVNNSGDITNADVTRLKAVYQNKTDFSW